MASDFINRSRLAASIFVLVVGLIAASHSAQAKQLGVELEMRVQSPAIPIHELIDGWAESGKGQYAQGRAQFESWVRLDDGLTLGYVKRADYHLAFTQNTSLFYSRLENFDLEPGRYPLSLSVNALSAEGLFAQYFIPLSTKGRFFLKASVLQGSVVQLGTLKGEGEVFSDGGYEYRYDLDYYYDHNRLLNSPEEPVEGYGYALDIGLEYSLGRHWSLEGEIKDWLYHMYWLNINRDQGCLASPVTADCDGTSAQETVRQRIRSDSRWRIYGKGQRFNPYVQWGSWVRHSEVELGVLYKKWSLGWEANHRQANLSYESDRLQVKWAFDSPLYKQAHQWQLQLGVTWPFQ